MFAPGQTAEIMAPLTDAVFAPIGHDQITASFFSNGFSVAAPPPGAPRREESQLSAGLLLSSTTGQHFITTGMVMRKQIDNPSLPLPKRHFGSLCIVGPDPQLLLLPQLYPAPFRAAPCGRGEDTLETF